MVSKITVFEAHFDGAQFGPASIEAGREENGQAESRPEDQSGAKSPVTTLLQGATVFVVLFVVLWIALSRLLSEDEDEDGPE